eukprot:SAG11_NODE_1422_length_4951_cov_4.752112_3_plen_45_part_00
MHEIELGLQVMSLNAAAISFAPAERHTSPTWLLARPAADSPGAG